MSDYHLPVLLTEVIEFLAPTPPGVIVDATFGGGGHARALAAAPGQHRVVGIDRDPDARANAGDVQVLGGDFGDFDELLDEAGIGAISGALFDLGISSHQVDQAGRGFSFHAEGPLDMRMDTTQRLSASEVVNTYTESELASDRDDDPTRRCRRHGDARSASSIRSPGSQDLPGDPDRGQQRTAVDSHGSGRRTRTPQHRRPMRSDLLSLARGPDHQASVRRGCIRMRMPAGPARVCVWPGPRTPAGHP